MAPDLLIRAPRAIVGGREVAASVRIRDGVIAVVEDLHRPGRRRGGSLGGDEVLLPGLVDTHVHVNQPGRTEWEGFASATRAAAAGGVTTIIDMPLNSIPPTTTVAGLEVKLAAAWSQAYVDVGFWGGAVPHNLADLEPLHDAGVFGFKCFLLPSGVDEFPAQPGAGERAGRDGSARSAADRARRGRHEGHRRLRREYAGFVASCLPVAERSAIERLIATARLTGARVHVVHLWQPRRCRRFARPGLPAYASRSRPARTTSRSPRRRCPTGAPSSCSAIRDAGNQDQLWAALAEGTIDAVVSDDPAVRAGA